MDPESFRSFGHRAVDWMADYMRDVRKLRVVPDLKPGAIRSRLPASAPEKGEPFEALFRDFREIVVPGMTHWNHPGWFAYFPANNSPPSVLAEMLTAAIGAQCMSWQTSPAATELEQVVMEWLRKMTGLPDGFTGVIQDTASSSTLVALLTARERATKWGVVRDGASAPDASKLAVYASTEAHSSVDKGVKIAGIGLSRLRRIPADDAFAMVPEALEEAIVRDEKAGLVPCAAVATVGTTSSTAVDPLRPIGEICRRHGAWFHVDGAMGGTAAVLPEMRRLLDGIELADSYVFNPHKWMFTNFDCSAYYVRDVEALLRTLSMSPEYLKTLYDPQVENLRDWGIPLGRRFRALKLWFVIRSFGAEGIREKVREHLALAQEFKGWVEGNPDFELLAPVPLSLVCFRFHPRGRDAKDPGLDALNEKLLAAVNASGRVHLTHTKLKGRFAIRLSIGQLGTKREDVEAAWKLCTENAARV
ncbi:MAG: pyridoxal-dependent decarboxylase [Planctomycetes bacterium]|nr:pyridoxal-dependent decarboxylase [Planctomycetota bacterium]